MRHFSLRSSKSLVSATLFLHLLSSDFCYTQSSAIPLLLASGDSLEKQDETKYTVNFNHVPIVEVIRFVSKITHTNFIFEENDLQFSVSILSEEPISAKNITSALIQILRVHDLRLLEQDNNLLITKSTEVRQIPTLISAELPLSEKTEAPIVTRVFRIKNANPASIATIIRPMVSAASQIEVSQETRQLIVTDILTNIDKIASLLISLDAPNTQLEIESYVVKHIGPSNLIALTQQILSAFADKNPLIFVPQPETNTIFIVSTPYLTERALTIMEDLDIPPKGTLISDSGTSNQDLYIYKMVHKTPFEVVANLKDLYAQIHESGSGMSSSLLQALHDVKQIPDTDSLLFITDAGTWAKVQNLLAGIDALPSQTVEKSSFWIYNIQQLGFQDIESYLINVSKDLHDGQFSYVIENMKWNKESNSIVFKGPESVLKKLQEMLPNIDSPNGGQKFYVYQVQNVSKQQILTALTDLTKDLQDPNLSKSIANVKWIQENHSLVFNGTADVISKLQSILPTLDLATLANPKNNFIFYTPVNLSGEALYKQVQDLAMNLEKSGLENADVLSALRSATWTPSSNSLLFTGDSQTLSKVQKIVEDLDKSGMETPIEVFLYQPQYLSQDELKKALDLLGKSLNSSDAASKNLLKAIQNVQWVPQSNSFLFKADSATLTQLKQALATLDNANAGQSSLAHSFYLYRLQQASGTVVIQNLKDLTGNIASEDPQNIALIKAIKGLKWVKENNSILITAPPQIIEIIKPLIAEFDVASPLSGADKEKMEFFIYKPTTQSPEQIQTSLQEFAKDLELSQLNDPDFLHTLHSIRYVPASKSLVFVGTPDSLVKLKNFLSTLDSTSGHAPIQKIGGTTFLIYKVQNASASELINSLQTFSKQLAKSDISDKALGTCLDTVKWIKETNSLLFTGSEETLQKTEKLLEKFDLTSLHHTAPRASTATFFVYNPKYQTGSELIHILEDFQRNLANSSVSDPQLFEAIAHLKFIDKTNSLIISGDEVAIQKVHSLLEKFDVPGPQSALPSISNIDNANFLIYKLQYHKGIEILTALKQVSQSLMHSDKQEHKALVDCVNSLQWIEVTNSLLGTGDAGVLDKVKGLIQNLDVPLKQVFIEVLVIQTSLENSQTFGLQWGSQLQYLNKTVGAMGNFPAPGSNNNNFFQSPLSLTTATSPPVQGGTSTTSVPFTSGFDIGVIGDIIFHKGKSFLSLGSLLNAIQVDSDATVVMNPKIMAQDGHTSNVFSGQNIPFVGSFVSNQGQTTTETSNIEYRDVGFNLIVTPTLGTNDIITLEISQDITQQVPTSVTFSTGTVQGIQTSRATMATRVHVPDRHFLVLSGMIQDTKQHTKQGLPCLGGLPMVGALFSQNSVSDQKLNVMIFMKPYILRSMADFDHLTEQEESLMQAEAVLPDVKETQDSAMEMIKNIE
ncbi:MAG: hypothetical protein K2Y01_05875 [Rhabdochlamydiaceae bacterium]|nr:hypothetical protein [Rhabdochlamydiaceae bacterium]